MKKKNKLIIIIAICLIVVSIIAVGGYFGINYLLKKGLEKVEEGLQQSIEKYGYVEKENVATIVAKFNKEIMDNGMQYPASEDYFMAENEQYWYGMFDDVSCFIIPQEFTNNREEDIVEVMGIYYPKDSKNEKMALEYARHLIKANNEDLTKEDIDYLMEEAERLSPERKTANNGKGISVAWIEAEDHYEYQIIRLYE